MSAHWDCSNSHIPKRLPDSPFTHNVHTSWCKFHPDVFGLLCLWSLFLTRLPFPVSVGGGAHRKSTAQEGPAAASPLSCHTSTGILKAQRPSVRRPEVSTAGCGVAPADSTWDGRVVVVPSAGPTGRRAGFSRALEPYWAYGSFLSPQSIFSLFLSV